MSFPLTDVPNDVWPDNAPVVPSEVRGILNEVVRTDGKAVFLLQPQDGAIPNFSTASNTLTVYADSILCYGARSFVLSSDTTIDLTTNETTADKIYFDGANQTFVVRDWDDALSDSESRTFFLFGVARAPDDFNQAAIPNISLTCDYTIDGAGAHDIVGDYIGIILPQDGDAPDLDTVSKTFTIFADTIITWRNRNFVVGSDQVLDLSANPTTAERVFFDVRSESFVVKSFSASLSVADRRKLLFVAGIRSADTNNPSAVHNVSIPCAYTINGASASVSGAVSSGAGDDYDDLVRGVAHRGFSAKAPENTLPAYILAKRKGFVFVEADLRLTSDNEWVLLHDVDVDRTSNGSGNIDSLTLAQARTFDYSNGVSGYSETAIPTVAEFFALCKRLSLTAIVELKTDPDQARVDDLIALAEATGMAGNVWYNAFDIAVMDKVSAANPAAKIGHGVSVIDAGVISGLTSRKTAVNEVYLIPQFSNLTPSTAALAHAEGIEMYCWTVNTGTDVPLAANLGVRGIMTDVLLVRETLMFADGVTSAASEASDILGEGFPTLPEDTYYSREAAQAATVGASVNSIVVGPESLRFFKDASGTALSTNGTTVNWAPSGVVFVDHYGENEDPGTTDMTAAFQAAAAAAVEGSIIKFIPGREYRITSTVNITQSGVVIDATGATITADPTLGPEAAGRPDGVVNFIGADPVITTLSADAADFSETVTVASSSGMSPGDVIHFFNGQSGVNYRWYTSDGATVARNHINRIASISGNTITLNSPLPRGLDATSFTCVVRVYSGLKNVGVIGGKWEGGGYDHALENGKGTAAAYFSLCQNVVFKPEHVGGFSGAQMWADDVYGLYADVPSMQGHDNDYTDAIVAGTNSGFYGLRVDQCRAVVLRGGVSSRTRHTTDGMRSEDVLVQGFNTYNNHRTPHGSHEGCDNWRIVDCHAEGPNGFALWRGFNAIVSGCSLVAPNDSEAFFYDTVGAAGDLKRDYVISGCQTKTGREALRLEAEIGKVTISNCQFSGGIEGASYNTIYLGDSINHLQMAGGVIDANDANDAVGGAVTPRVRGTIQFLGTVFKNYAAKAIDINAVATETQLLVSDAIFESGNSVTDHIDLGAAAYKSLSVLGHDDSGVLYSLGIEKTFVPQFGDSGGNCTLDAASLLTYTQVGNRITITGEIRLTNVNGVTGALMIKNLPHVVGTSTGANGGGLVTWYTDMDASLNSAVSIRALRATSEGGFYITGAGTMFTMNGSHLTNTSRMFVHFSYITD